jgi:hypothetical protein
MRSAGGAIRLTDYSTLRIRCGGHAADWSAGEATTTQTRILC